MRLIWIELVGFRRFQQAKMNLDGKLVAVVGPNEAGKSSLLTALGRLSDTSPIAPSDFTRGAPPSDGATVINASFLLDKSDLAALAHVPGGSSVRWFSLGKRKDGQLVTGVRPPLPRDLRPRRSMSSAIRRTLKHAWWSEQGDDGERDEYESLYSQLTELAVDLDRSDPTLSPDAIARVDAAAALVRTHAAVPKSVSALAPRMDRLAELERLSHPSDVARTVLFGRRPPILAFDQEARELASEYELEDIDIESPPAALRNLANLAGLDLGAVRRQVTAGEYGGPEKDLEDANKQLRRFFEEHWRQSGVTVRLSLHETILRVLVSTTGGTYTSIRERSDGLRSFVALVAYTARLKGDQPPILLVDEAETHLHYDAQRDVVDVFTMQQVAAKVVYTTHSAGCLPQDLASVRVIAPVAARDRSEVLNWFWTTGPGFSPLLLGMGASALAFAAPRRAVIAEGAADLVMLPTLLREAANTDYLGFQVAPGLSEVSSEAVTELELEAARVVYVVDGDAGGRLHASKLRGAGIPDERIVFLGARIEEDLSIEDVLVKELYLSAVNEELRRSGRDTKMVASDLPDSGRTTAVERWCRERGFPPPRKVAVAQRVVIDLKADYRALIAPSRRTVVKSLYGDLQKALREIA